MWLGFLFMYLLIDDWTMSLNDIYLFNNWGDFEVLIVFPQPLKVISKLCSNDISMKIFAVYFSSLYPWSVPSVLDVVLTNCMKQIPSWETDSCSASPLLFNMMVHYCVLKSPRYYLTCFICVSVLYKLSVFSCWFITTVVMSLFQKLHFTGSSPRFYFNGPSCYIFLKYVSLTQFFILGGNNGHCSQPTRVGSSWLHRRRTWAKTMLHWARSIQLILWAG